MAASRIDNPRPIESAHGREATAPSARATSAEYDKAAHALHSLSAGLSRTTRPPFPATLPRLRCSLPHLLRGVPGHHPAALRLRPAPRQSPDVSRPCGAPELIPASYAPPSSGSSIAGGPTSPGRWHDFSPIHGSPAAAPQTWSCPCPSTRPAHASVAQHQPPSSRAHWPRRSASRVWTRRWPASAIRRHKWGCRPAPAGLNVRDAPSAPGRTARPLQGQTVLLVDDVKTTGATLCASATACRAAGALRVVGAGGRSRARLIGQRLNAEWPTISAHCKQEAGRGEVRNANRHSSRGLCLW